MPPFGVKAVVRLLRAPKPFNLPLQAPLNTRTANLSLLVVVKAPSSGPLSSTPFYYSKLRRINSTRPDRLLGVPLIPLIPLVPLMSLVLVTGWPLSTVSYRVIIIGYVSRSNVKLEIKAINLRSLPRNYITRLNS